MKDTADLRSRSHELLRSQGGLGSFFLRSLKDFNPWHNLKHWRRNPKQDVLAGATVAVISVPMAMAFGVASGLGAATGVWGTICGGIFVGLFGGSTVGISGPTSPKVVQLAMVMKDHMLPDGSPDLTYAFTLVFLSGIIVLLLGLLRVGRLVYYTPYSVVSGFMCGIGVILIVLEINPMLGLPGAPSLREAILGIPHAVVNMHWPAALVSGVTFASIVLWEKFRPKKMEWFPAPLLGLAVGISLPLAGGVLGLPLEVEMVRMTSGLPKLYVPDASQFASMIGPAFALAGLCAFDSLLTCLICDTMTDDRHDSNRELFGQGIANMACGLVGGVTTATATMRSVANIKCGARSSLSSVTMGVVMLALMLGLAPYAGYVPMACLAGILLKVGLDILDYRVLPVLRRLPLTDLVCFFAVLGLTLWTDLLVAVGVGLAIAFFRFVQEMGEIYGPEVASLDELPLPWSGEEKLSEEFKRHVLILHQEGPMFFGLSNAIYNTMERLVHYDVLIVRMGRVRYMDLSGAYLLEDLIEKARSLGAHVILTGMSPPVQDLLQRLQVLQRIGRDNVFDRFEDAVERAKQLYQNGQFRSQQREQPPAVAVSAP